jgi:hypothetical protein
MLTFRLCLGAVSCSLGVSVLPLAQNQALGNYRDLGPEVVPEVVQLRSEEATAQSAVLSPSVRMIFLGCLGSCQLDSSPLLLVKGFYEN